MSNKIKDIDIKNHTYYFFDDIFNITNFDPNNIKKDEKSYKNILIYYIGYVTIKDSKYVKVNGVYPLYLPFSKNLIKFNKSKYLTLVPANESKEKIIIRDLFRSIYLMIMIKKYMKIKFVTCKKIIKSSHYI